MALLAGAWILSNLIDVHAATAGEICDHAVQRHGVDVDAGADPETEVVLEARLRPRVVDIPQSTIKKKVNMTKLKSNIEQ